MPVLCKSGMQAAKWRPETIGYNLSRIKADDLHLVVWRCPFLGNIVPSREWLVESTYIQSCSEFLMHSIDFLM